MRKYIPVKISYYQYIARDKTFYLLPRILYKKLSFRTSFPRPFLVNHQITGKQLNWLFITKCSNFVS